ncbi:hypothetical protein [Paraburkholderia solisilvae]|uniref:Uncharacterized protein n=1 Tax=Paraburkholderia solisilvae TaxID=624376 RepID=A0A6J5DIR7_9BURK|nr:hypothetical protein [Paraburkholderia solisilvae]CAB3754140.1 hypothetical protein LMG29739_01904 [Paraburkholderia solisilvae]
MTKREEKVAQWELIPEHEVARYSSELEVIRSALPHELVRNSVDTGGQAPTMGKAAAIFRRPSEFGEAYEDWLLVWKVGESDDAAPNSHSPKHKHRRVVGYVRRRRDGAHLRLIAPFVDTHGEPEEARNPHDRLGSSLTPWHGPADAAPDEPGQVKNESNMDPQNFAERDEASLDEQLRQTHKSISKLSEKFIAPAERYGDDMRWWRNPRVVNADSLEKLYEYLKKTALRFYVSRFTPDEWKQSQADEYELPFYRNYSLFKITTKRENHPDETRFFIAHTKREPAPVCVPLSTSIPIYAFNDRLAERGELLIDARTVAAYLVFFSRSIDGKLGPFWIVEEDRDFVWTGTDDRANEVRRAVVRSLQPIQRLLDPDESKNDGHYYLTAFVNYGAYLFFSRFDVDAQGHVEMQDDAPCFSLLPVRTRGRNAELQSDLPGSDVLDGRYISAPAGMRAHGADLVAAAERTLTESEETRLRDHLRTRSIVNFTLPDKNDSNYSALSLSIRSLSFYRGYSLIRVTDRRGLYAKSFFIILDDAGNGNAPACHLGHSIADLVRFNQSLAERGIQALNIDSTTVADYLQFYYRPYVQCANHEFSIAASLEELRWSSRHRASGNGVANVKSSFEQIHILKSFESVQEHFQRFRYFKGSPCFELLACTYSRNEFASARFTVNAGGTVFGGPSMVLVTDPPLIPEIYDERWQFRIRGNHE